MAFLGSSILASDSGAPFFREIQTLTTPGLTQTLISYTLGAAEELYLNQFIVTCRQSGVIVLKKNTEIIASGRTGPANLNLAFSFAPSRIISSTETVMLEFTQRTGSPATDIEAYLQASIVT